MWLWEGLYMVNHCRWINQYLLRKWATIYRGLDMFKGEQSSHAVAWWDAVLSELGKTCTFEEGHPTKDWPYIFWQLKKQRNKEMERWHILPTLPEDQSWVLSTHVGRLTTTYNSSSKESNALSEFHRHMWNIVTQTQIRKNKSSS